MGNATNTRLPKADAALFTATPHYSAEEKAKMADTLIRFIAADCPRSKFTHRLYRTLSTNLFHHIAHFDRDGFWHVWLSTPTKRVKFLENALGPVIDDPENGVSIAVGHRGPPEHCWVDVERYVARWIADSGALDRARAERDAALEAAERAELASLTAKYDATPTTPGGPPMTPPSPAEAADLIDRRTRSAR